MASHLQVEDGVRVRFLDHNAGDGPQHYDRSVVALPRVGDYIYLPAPAGRRQVDAVAWFLDSIEIDAKVDCS